MFCWCAHQTVKIKCLVQYEHTLCRMGRCPVLLPLLESLDVSNIILNCLNDKSTRGRLKENVQMKNNKTVNLFTVVCLCPPQV